MQISWEPVPIQYSDKLYQFPKNKETGAIYNLDPEILIRGKCAALIILTPATTVIRTVYWVSISILMSLAEGFHYLDGRDINKENMTFIKDTITDVPRALSYGSLLTIYAIAGVFFPFWARHHYGQMERELNRHADGPHRNKFYLAICFQPVVKQDEFNLSQKVMNKLNDHIQRIEKIQKAFWPFDYRQLMMELKLLRKSVAKL